MHIVLASASPRRLELLRPLGHTIEVRPADIDESVLAGEQPLTYVQRLSAEKAAAITDVDPAALLIAADTTVDVDGVILGKPAGHAEARQMLTALSARAHLVHTGVTVRHADRLATGAVTTVVTFTPITDAALDWYVETGEPFDKAGAYAIQGAGGVFVAAVEGSVSNVIGLPLTLVRHLAASIGVELLT